MNRILTFSVITAVAVIMGSSIIAPVLADHDGNTGICPGGELWDPNTISCVPEDICPNGITISNPTSPATHCKLDTAINDDKKVVLCHQPSKSNGDPVTIEVSSNAVEKHLAHGDIVGACYT